MSEPHASGSLMLGRLKRFNINLLYALDAILNARTLTEAGRRVFLTQPAMSAALRKLREHFDDGLVSYVGGVRALTPLAEALRPRVRQLLREAEDVFNLTLAFDPATERRSVRIAAPEYLEIVFLSRAVKLLRKEAPGIDVCFLPYDAATIDKIFDSGLDLLIQPARLADDRYEKVYLCSDELGCMVWTGNMSVGDSITQEEFLSAPHAAVYENNPSPLPFGGEGTTLMAARRVVVTTNLYSALPNLIIGTDIIATSSMWLLQHFQSMMDVRVVSKLFDTDPMPIIAQWQPHRGKDPFLMWLIAMLSEFATGLAFVEQSQKS